jgi:hypothetical protein
VKQQAKAIASKKMTAAQRLKWTEGALSDARQIIGRHSTRFFERVDDWLRYVLAQASLGHEYVARIDRDFINRPTEQAVFLPLNGGPRFTVTLPHLTATLAHMHLLGDITAETVELVQEELARASRRRTNARKARR